MDCSVLSAILKIYSNGSTTDFRILSDGFSIQELSMDAHSQGIGNSFTESNPSSITHSLCNKEYKEMYLEETLDSIHRALNFYNNHLYMLDTIDSVFGLMILKRVDDKHGQKFQKVFPLSKWMAEICSQFTGDIGGINLPRVWNASPSKKTLYKSWDSITKHFARWDLNVIANEKESIWGPLNAECQSALLNRCEVPRLCEQTMLDPEPRTQYLLTHQLLLRIFIEQRMDECPQLKRYIDYDVNDQLCARMYKEAELVSNLGYPHMLRDIFVEYVAFCGHLGYPNFFREDWLQNILSWQSSSDFGCFRHEKDYKSIFVSSDEPLMRVTTPAESSKGLESDEMCLPHFTAVGLSALAVHWDYMEENCV